MKEEMGKPVIDSTNQDLSPLTTIGIVLGTVVLIVGAILAL